MAEPADHPRPDQHRLGRRRALWLGLGVLAVGGAGTATVFARRDGDGDRAVDDPGDGDDGSGGADRAGAGTVVVHASPTCGCCAQYVEYLRAEGFAVDSRLTEELDAVKADLGVPEEAAGCHTAVFEDYVVEGHVPVEAIHRLLRERPAVDGIALPGMPTGTPGMSGPKEGPFEIVSITGRSLEPYMTI